jgi:hypothetical protein
MQIVVRRRLAPGVSTMENDELAELVAYDQLAARVAVLGLCCGLGAIFARGFSHRAAELGGALLAAVYVAAHGFRVRVALQRHRVTIARTWLGITYRRHELDTASVELAPAQGKPRSWTLPALRGLAVGGAQSTRVRVGSAPACAAIAGFLREQLARLRNVDSREV